MSNAQLIPAKGKQGVESFTLRVQVKGEPLTIPGTVQVYGLSVGKEVNRIPYAKALIIDGDPAKQDFEVSSEDWFAPGNPIEIFLGYLNDPTRVFKGVIIKQQLSIRQGISMLEIDCRDAAYRMTLHRKGRYFEDLSDSDLAAGLLREHKLDANIATTRHKHAALVQYDCTDWDFLLSRMDANGLLTILDDGKARVQPPDFKQTPALHLHHGATVIEFDGGLELRDQHEQVLARAWNPGDQAIVEIPAKAPVIKENGNLPGQTLSKVNGTGPITHRHGGNVSENELQAWADARLLKDRLSRTCGRVQFQGYNAIKPGQIVELYGFGSRFNGPVYVAAVHHEYVESGWLTEIEFGLSPKWFAEIVKMEAQPAAGMLPAVNGLQIGLVTQIEDDPGGNHRIRVRLPILDAEAAGIWARVATFDAGANRGAVFMPEVNDEVIVGFINDDPRDAVVLGMLHSRDKSAPFTAAKDNHEKGYVSREGLKLVFRENDRSIALETPGGNKLVISDDGKGLLLSDQNGNQIQMNDKGITLSSPKSVSIESKGQAKFKANSLTEIKGNPVNIN